MDATRVGCRTVAEWIQTANLVSSASESENAATSSTTEWAFLYLLVLPLRTSSAARKITDLQSIPPVELAADLAGASLGGVSDGLDKKHPLILC